MTQLLYLSPEEFCATEAGVTRIVKLFDAFTERLRDSNSKVCLFALQTLKEWIGVLRDAMNTVLITVLPVLASNLAASNTSIRNASNEIFDAMVNQFNEKTLVTTLQTLSNLIQFGGSASNNAINNAKVKAVLIEKIMGKFQYK